jgi:preprotein translocase SecE subunit
VPGQNKNPENQTPVAQLVEQRIPNPQVAGSSPSRRDIDGNGADRPPTTGRSDGGGGRPLGIYKYGQGYWVRMMTALAAGILLLSAAAWIWGELEKVGIPTPRWTLTTSLTQGGNTAAPGQTATLQRIVDNQVQTLGTALVESYSTAGRRDATLVIGSLKMEAGANPIDINHVEIGAAGASQPALRAAVSRAAGIPLFPRLWLQAGVAAVIMLAGSLLIYWFVGVKATSVDFLIATDGEMKKVNWSSKRVIRDSTYVVIGASLLITAVIFVADILLQRLASAMGIMG